MNSALPSKPMSLTCLAFLMLPFHLCVGLQNFHLPPEFSNKHLYVFLLPHKCHMSLRCHSLLSDQMNVKYLVRFKNSANISLCDFLPTPVTSFDLGSNIVLSTLFTNIVSLRPSLKVTDHGAPIYKTAGKLRFCISEFKFQPFINCISY